MNHRSFHYSDDKSNKYWKITLNGNSHTVNYGRVGTTGQTQTKEFTNETEALKSYEKLVTEKLKKGYIEVTSNINSANESEKQKSLVELLEVTSYIELNPDDWIWSTWRRKTPLKTNEVKSFDKKEALKRLAKLIHINGKNRFVNWKEVQISRLLCQEEAQFWFMAMTDVARLQPIAKAEIEALSKEAATAIYSGKSFYIWDEDLLANLVQKPLTNELEQQFIISTLIQSQWQSSKWGYWYSGWAWEITPEIVIPLANLLEIIELVITLNNLAYCNSFSLINYLETTWGSGYISNCAASINCHVGRIRSQQELESDIVAEIQRNIPEVIDTLSKGLATYILPYCTEAEIEAMRLHIRPELNLTLSSFQLYIFAAHLEMHEEVQQWIEFQTIPGNNANQKHPIYDLFFALGDANLIESEMRRLQFLPQHPTYIRATLAHLEYRAFDLIRNSILQAGSKQEAAKLVKAFAIVKSSEAAPYMLEFLLYSKAPQVAQYWLNEHPIQTILGLVGVAAGRCFQSAQMTSAAIAYLQTLKRKGYTELIEAAMARESIEVSLESEVISPPTFDQETAPKWLQRGITDINSLALKPINWVNFADLPPILIGEYCLNNQQITACLQALRQSTLKFPHPLVSALKSNVGAGLDVFTWALFEHWLKVGAPVKEKWAMEALGLLGSDAIAFKLTPLIRIWPGQSQHPRAVRGLECLRAIGTDTALIQINSIAQKVKFKGIKERAIQCMEAIANSRNLTREQLADRIIPTFDLDETGSRVFNFGSRQFHFVLLQLKPMLRDEVGLKTDLPKPGVKNNPDLANQALQEWKVLKKQIKEVIKLQTLRLEQAMITERRWKIEEFEMFLVRHPLMFQIVRLWVWNAFNSQGKRIGTFRITQDKSYANIAEETFKLESVAEVGIIHPLHLPEIEQKQWSDLFNTYAIMQPFAQLNRPIYNLNSSEVNAQEITRFRNIKIPAIALRGTLEKLGWMRGSLCDSGFIYEHLKSFEGGNITAIVNGYEGIQIGLSEDESARTIPQCFFIPGIHTEKTLGESLRWGRFAKPIVKVPLHNINPVIISEVLIDLTAVAAKGK